MAVGVTFMVASVASIHGFLEQAQQVFSSSPTWPVGSCQHFELGIADPPAAPGHFFWRSDLEALPIFYGVDELAGLQHGLVGAGVEPGVPRPMVCTSSSPRSRYMRLRSVISSSPGRWA